jgi:hypothetical protein
MASIGPIVAVLSTGLYIRWKISRRVKDAEAAEVAADPIGATIL